MENPITIPIDGKKTSVEIKYININLLTLDELNPRISFFKDNQPNESLSEKEIIFALTNKRPESYRKLRDSILNNKGIIYPIWIEPFSDKTYKVIEGNTRVLIYKELARDEPNEINWKTIMSLVLPVEIKNEEKDFIRLLAHLRGTNEWDAYEKAKYLYKLWKEEGWSKTRLEKQTKLTIKQIEENIEAYELIEEKYLLKYSDDPNEVNKFSYFVEYVKDTRLQKSMHKEGLSVDDFCTWVYDRNMIPTGQDVRKLKDIFENNDTKRTFINKGFDAAMQILEFKKPHLVSPLYRCIEEVIEGLKSMTAYEIDEIISEKDSEKAIKIKELNDWSLKVLKQISKI